MTQTIHISGTIELPIDVTTQSIAILGRRGSGKSYTASVCAEELLWKSMQCVIIDPTDSWFGLRSSADGKSDGFQIIVFGGSHADVPLEPGAGKLIAELVVEQGISIILSLRHLSKQAQRDLVAAFGERLYELKGQPKNRSPLHLFVDEADEFVPQRLSPQCARCFGAIDTIVRRGRSSGLGTTLISQRAAVLSKDVLTQTEILIAHQTTGPQDRAALEAWIDAHDSDDRGEEFLASLASLPVGTGWIWSPSFMNIFAKFKTRERITFDSSATPKVGELRAEPKKVAAIDLDKIRAAMASTLERAEKENPAKLRARIAELERQLAARAKPVEPKVVKVLDVEMLRKLQIELQTTVAAYIEVAEAVAIHTYHAPVHVAHQSVPAPVRSPKAIKTHADWIENQEQKLTKADRSILAVLRNYPARSKRQLAVFTGYAINGGGFQNAIGHLRTLGLIEGSNDAIKLTAAGRREAQHVPSLPRGRELWNYWLSQCNKCERAILEALNAAGGSRGKVEIARDAGYEPTGGGFQNALGRLRTLELIEGKLNIQLHADFAEAILEQ